MTNIISTTKFLFIASLVFAIVEIATAQTNIELLENGSTNTADATLLSQNPYGNLGENIAVAGDVNGDGYTDFIASVANEPIQLGSIAAKLYYGSPTGINPTPAYEFAAVKYYKSSDGSYPWATTVNSFAGAGDVNGDGYSDIIVGSFKLWYDDGNGNSYANQNGGFTIYLGSANGLSSNTNQIKRIYGDKSNSNFGNTVACAGDVNGDGYSDVLVGATNYDDGDNGLHAVFLYFGSATNIIESTPKTFFRRKNSWGSSGNRFGEASGGGSSLAGAGDVNGDGYSDIIIGAHTTKGGKAFIYHGNSSGIDTVPSSILKEGSPTYSTFGRIVSTAGDFNGDGYSDIVISDPSFYTTSTRRGAVYLYLGSSSGISSYAQRYVPNITTYQWGWGLACAGDVNADGLSDFITSTTTNYGTAYLYLGKKNNSSSTYSYKIDGTANLSGFGHRVAPAGDLNGDGYSDYIIGAHLWSDVEESAGALFQYFGKPDSLNQNHGKLLEQNQENAYFGWSIDYAGDINGDGFSDFISGAPYYDNGSEDEGIVSVYYGSAEGLSAATILESNVSFANFGNSTANAGDVNGDGYGDIVVGAPNYSNSETSEGAVYIFSGSANGINTTALNTLESNVAGMQMGQIVSNAGDFNNDGYSDVLVGIPYYTNGQTSEGLVKLFYGSSSGISASNCTNIELNVAYAGFGSSVAGAGDINGDGYADIIIGAPYYKNGQNQEGAVVVYYGSETGINTSSYFIKEINQAYAYFGNAVACAGDVNGDGYSDVMASANYYDNGESNEGAVFLFYGSVNGLSLTISKTIEGNLANANLGSSIKSCGDVNNDGYSDIILGASGYNNGQSNEGAFFIYLGSENGIFSQADFMQESNTSYVSFGYSVCGMGDINGDGYADFACSAPYYNNGENYEGIVRYYYGNDNENGLRKLQLFNVNTTNPLSLSNINSTSFTAGFSVTPFLGRTRAKFVWEKKGAGEIFSAQNSVSVSGYQTSFSDIGFNNTLLTNNILKSSGNITKIRARVKYDPSMALTGQVYGPWTNVASYYLGNSNSSINPLPVVFNFFTATPINNQSVQLNWQTASEINCDYYEVQHSTDLIEWVSFDKVTGAGTSFNENDYQTYHNAPSSGVNYYRLKQFDFDGTTDYSKISTVNFSTNLSENQPSIFPNPTSHNLYIFGNDLSNEIMVYTIDGKNLSNQVSILEKSENQIVIDTSLLKNGIYILHCGNSIVRFTKI